jgi:hypothetical protein
MYRGCATLALVTVGVHAGPRVYGFGLQQLAALDLLAVVLTAGKGTPAVDEVRVCARAARSGSAVCAHASWHVPSCLYRSRAGTCCLS